MAEVCLYCNGDLIGCPVCNNPPPKKRLSFRARVINKMSAFVFPSQQVWEVQGIDISKWNGVMDFSITKTKCQYAIVRLGYGNEWKDRNSDIYYAGLLAQDMPVGVYWYAQIGLDWMAHADSFAEQIALHPPQLDIVIDAEQTTLSPTETFTWLQRMDGRLRDKTGRDVIIYTSKGFWDSHVAPNTYFKGRLRWVASWTSGPTPAIPRECTEWERWQWSADGNRKAKEFGMIKDGDFDMDLNRENCTVNAFNLKHKTHIEPIGGIIVPPVPNPDEIIPSKYVYIKSGSLNIRSLPSISGKDIGTLAYGDDIPIVEECNGWYRINGWINADYTRPKS